MLVSLRYGIAVVLLAVGSSQLVAQEAVRSEVDERTAEWGEMLEPDAEVEEIETDRDSFTPSVATAPMGRFIFESAYSFIDNDRVAETHSFPEMLIRYGVNEWLEVRLGWNYEIGGAGSPISGNIPGDFEEEASLEEETRIFYGIKAALTEQDVWLPKSVVILQGFTPTSGEQTATEFAITYAAGYELENRSVWESSLRYATAGEQGDDFGVWAPSTVLKLPIGERWKAHAEYFGIFSQVREEATTQHYFSPGAHYLISPDFEIGARVGWGLNDQAANFFANVGIGLQF